MKGTMEDHYLVIMAGGVGSRFWPMSTFERPKQFIDVLGIGKTLFQDTIERFSDFCAPGNIFVVTSEEYSPIIREQAPQIPEGNILSEPMRRNTAPCIAYASYKIKELNPNAVVIVSPADHFVRDTQAFGKVIATAADWLEKKSGILTLGIKPTRPETGYGYIHFSADSEDTEVVPVIEFKEKPDEVTAKKYLDSGHYWWNSGIFAWKIQTIIDAFRAHLPVVDQLFDQIDRRVTCKEDLESIYEQAPEISIDYGILEHASNIHVISADCGWSDLGTWNSLWLQENHDTFGNSLLPGKTDVYNSRNCIIRVQPNKEIIIDGLEDYIVVDDPDHLLICPKSNEQNIGKYSKKLQSKHN